MDLRTAGKERGDVTRWSMDWPDDTPTVDRLGDHTAARYRCFRRFVERLDDERLDHALFGLLLSAESMRDEMRAYEQQRSALVRLAQTGHFVRQLERLHGVLDAVSALYNVDEPEALNKWEGVLAEERAARMERFKVLLDSDDDNNDNSSDDGVTGRDSIWSEIETQAQQEEVLSLLMGGMNKYGGGTMVSESKDEGEDKDEDENGDETKKDDGLKKKTAALTPQEIWITAYAFNRVANRCGMVVMALPEWFALPFEFGATFGLSRWGNDLFKPSDSDPTRFIQETSIWCQLNHPHVAKFLGACHVGGKMFIAHEKVKPLREYASEGKSRMAMWRRVYEVALALQYLHERGLACAQLDEGNVFCAYFEDKAVLLGAGLVELGGSAESKASAKSSSGAPTRELMSSSIHALGVLILTIIDASVSSKAERSEDNFRRYSRIPQRRPDFIAPDEWKVLERIRLAATDSTGGILHALSCLADYIGANRGDLVSDSSFQDAFHAANAPIHIGALVLPSVRASVVEVLAQCKSLSESDELAEQVQLRLQDVYHQLEAAAMTQPSGSNLRSVVVRFARALIRLYDLLQAKSRVSLSSMLRFSVSYASSSSFSSTAPDPHPTIPSDPPRVFNLHMEIDRLMRASDLDTSNTVHEWEARWVEWCSQMQSLSSISVTRVSAAANQPVEGLIAHGHDDARLLSQLHGGQASAAMRLRVSAGTILRSSLPRWFVPPTEVDINSGRELGRGSFGFVHSGKWFDTPVVVKRVVVDPKRQKTIADQFRHEANVWFQLNHINVVKMYGACHVGDLFFLCEFASGGDVDTYLRAKGREPSLIWYSLLNAALGLQYLHDNGVVHGDLKANNVLVGADGVVKLADFGLSTSTSGSQVGAHTGGALGAYRWKAPECLMGKSATFASDVYSFAMMMIELVSGSVPWGVQLDDAVVKYRSTRGELPLQPDEMADSEWHLIQRMCARDPTERVTIDAVVVHLTVLLETLDIHTVRTSARGTLPKRSFRNRVVSRGGALLSLLAVAKSGNTRLAMMAGEHLLAVHLNRGAQSDKREIEAIVDVLKHGSDAEKTWATEAIASICWQNNANRLLVREAGGIDPLVALVHDGTTTQKTNAAGALYRLAVDSKNKEWIASAGAIDPLVKLVRNGNDEQKTTAAGALLNLAVNALNKVAIASAGAIGPLVALVRNGTDEQKESAAGALMNLAANAENNVSIASADAIVPLVKLVRYGTDVQKKNSAGTLRNLAVKLGSKASIAAAGAIDPLVELLRDGTDDQKTEAAGALQNLSANSEISVLVASTGAISPLVELLRSGTDAQKVSAAGALFNLAASAESKILIASAGAINPLVELVSDGTDIQKKNATAVLMSLAWNTENKVLIASAGAITPLVDLLQNGTDDQKKNAAAVLWNLAEDDENKRAIAFAGAIGPLIELVRSGTEDQKENAAAALERMSVNAKNQICIASAGAIDPLVELLRNGTDDQKENAAGVLWNLAANSQNMVMIASAGVIDPLVEYVRCNTRAVRVSEGLEFAAAVPSSAQEIAGDRAIGAESICLRYRFDRQAMVAMSLLARLAQVAEAKATIIETGIGDLLRSVIESDSDREAVGKARALLTLSES